MGTEQGEVSEEVGMGLVGVRRCDDMEMGGGEGEKPRSLDDKEMDEEGCEEAAHPEEYAL